MSMVRNRGINKEIIFTMGIKKNPHVWESDAEFLTFRK